MNPNIFRTTFASSNNSYPIKKINKTISFYLFIFHIHNSYNTGDRNDLRINLDVTDSEILNNSVEISSFFKESTKNNIQNIKSMYLK